MEGFCDVFRFDILFLWDTFLMSERWARSGAYLPDQGRILIQHLRLKSI